MLILSKRALALRDSRLSLYKVSVYQHLQNALSVLKKTIYLSMHQLWFRKAFKTTEKLPRLILPELNLIVCLGLLLL
jgi:hypothetical protein